MSSSKKGMSLFQKIDQFFWAYNEDYYKKCVGYSAPCVSFVTMQIIRLVMLILVLIVWCANFYINVKKCLIYINFWALTFTVLSLVFLFTESGRQVIERQLASRKELEEKDKCAHWKIGVAFYTLAWPFAFASIVLFSALLWEDQLCQTYYDFGFDVWRGYIICISTYLPLLVLIVDFSLNRLTISYRHVITTVVMLTLYYFFFALTGSAA